MSYLVSSVARGETTLEPKRDPTPLSPQWRNLALPSLAIARKEAKLFTEMDDHSLAELPISKVTCEDRPWLLQRSQWLSIKNLFFFSMIADISDIPRDLIEQVISILHISVRIVSERPDADAHEWPHTLGMPPFEASNGDSRLPYLFMLPSLANRAACCLLREDVDRPDSAVTTLQFLFGALRVFEETIGIHTMPHESKKKPSSVSWAFREVYADALVLSGRLDAETMKLLESLLKSAGMDSTLGIKTQMHLIHGYQQMGVEVDKQKRYTENVVRLLRTNPYSRDQFATFMNGKNRPVHPVATALGPEWFITSEKRFRHQEKKHAKVKVTTGFCENCLASSADHKLSRCARCQRTQYCSKACQKANWKAHRTGCLELANTRNFVQQLGNTWIGDADRQKQNDIERWHYSTHYPCLHGPIHALGLQRDPKRGWTHIMIAEMTYTPDAVDDYRRHFRVSRCGVFLMKPEVMKYVEAILDKEVGWMEQFVRNHCEHTLLVQSDVPLAFRMPMFCMFFGMWFTPIVRCSVVNSGHVNGLGYDPHWRKSMNCATASRNPPPGPLRLACGAVDVEMVY